MLHRSNVAMQQYYEDPTMISKVKEFVTEQAQLAPDYWFDSTTTWDRTLLRTRGAVLQSHLLGDRVITTLGFGYQINPALNVTVDIDNLFNDSFGRHINDLDDDQQRRVDEGDTVLALGTGGLKPLGGLLQADHIDGQAQQRNHWAVKIGAWGVHGVPEPERCSWSERD